MLKRLPRSPPHQECLESFQLSGVKRSVKLEIQVQAVDIQNSSQEELRV